MSLSTFFGNFNPNYRSVIHHWSLELNVTLTYYDCKIHDCYAESVHSVEGSRFNVRKMIKLLTELKRMQDEDIMYDNEMEDYLKE